MRMSDDVYEGSDEGVEERMASMSDRRDENEERVTHWGGGGGGNECPGVVQGGRNSGAWTEE